MNRDNFLNLNDFELAAKWHLPRCIFGYISSGSEDGISRAANRSAFNEVGFVPRVLRDTSARTCATSLWGEEWSAPFGIAPMGAVAIAALDGDLALAKAALEENVPYVLSGSSLVKMERVIEVNPRAWFQIYPSSLQSDNDRTIARARACGFDRLVVTADVPVAGNREDDKRNGYGSPLRPSFKLAFDGLTHPSWLLGTFARGFMRNGMPHFENFAASRAPMISFTAQRSQTRDNISWDNVKKMRDAWPGKLVIKGLLSADDLTLATQLGADAVVVSNHGGRQLDGAVTPLSVLPSMSSRQDGTPRIPIFYDGGIRRGNDALKAVALGAAMTFIGRPFAYAAAVGGVEGVRHAISIVRAEIMRSMSMLGITDASQVAERIVSRSSAANSH